MSVDKKDASFSEKMKGFLRSEKKSCAVVLGLTLLVFSSILANGFFMDDYSFVVEWPLIQDLRNLPRFFVGYIPPEAQGGIYSPLRTLLFALNYAVWGLFPFGYHLFSLAVHGLGTFLVYRLSLLLTRNYLMAFLTALLFGLHPAHGESAGTITGSVDTAGVVLLFAAFYYYVKAVGDEGRLAVGDEVFARPSTQEVPGKEGRSFYGAAWRPYLLSLTLALLAIFTHELAVMLPLLIAFYDLLFRGRRIPGRDLAMRNAPFFFIAVVYVFLKWAVLGSICRGHYLYNSVYLTMLVAVKALAKYIWISFFPLRLTHNHVISKGIFSFGESDFDPQAVLSQSIFDPQVLLSLALLAGILGLAVRCYRKNPFVSFCVGWFFLCLLPTSQIVPSTVYFAERYLYPGSFTFCLLLAYFLHQLFFGHPRGLLAGRPEVGRRLGILLLVLLTAFYALRNVIRSFDGRNQVSVYRAAVRDNPYSAALRNDLGIVYAQAQQFDKAIASFEKAIALKPQNAHFYFSMAQAYFYADRIEEAIRALKRAVGINPDFAEAYFNLASAYGMQGQRDLAREYLRQAKEKYLKQGRILEAGRYMKLLSGYLDPREETLAPETRRGVSPQGSTLPGR